MDERSTESNIKNYEILTTHAYWVVDHYTSGLEKLRARAATLIGLISVEIGFLATWNKVDFPKSTERLLNALLIITLLGLVICLCGLLYCLRAKSILRPTTEQILWALDEKNMPKEELHTLPILAITNKDETNGKEMFDSLVEENATLAKLFNLSLLFCVGSQIVLMVFIYLRWVSKGGA